MKTLDLHLVSTKITGLLLGAMILFSLIFSTLTACTDSAAAAQANGAGAQLSRVEPSAYVKPEPGGAGILNPDAEVRGVWIASVMNLHYPSEKGLDSLTLAAELDAILDNCEENGFNTVYFQVRPAADALYRSELFPTSAYLTGEQGAALPDEFDPLAYLLQEGHARNIRVHAWVNPLRVTASGSPSKPETDVKALAESHPARKNPDWAIPYADGKLYFDAGIPAVRQYVIDGVAEIVRNYDVDGVIFDDYFYPYPTTEKVNGKNVKVPFDDDASFAAFGEDFENRDDWRRDNINQLVEGCYRVIKSIDDECQFGIAPFGIWQNDDGENGGSATSGLASYSEIYCDALAWIEGGYIDYIAPQIYWRFSSTAAPYDVLVRWWNARVDGTGVDLLISHGVYNYATWTDPEGEISQQIEYARSELGYRGSIHYGYPDIVANTKGLADELKAMYAGEIIYTAPVSNGMALTVTSPRSGSWIDAASTYLIGASDPTKPLRFEGQPVSRTKSGYFSLYVSLEEGENKFTFTYDGTEIPYILHRGVRPDSGTTATDKVLDGYVLSVSAPSGDVAAAAGSRVTLTCTAPVGSTVTAALGGQTVTLQNSGKVKGKTGYTADTYSGSFTLPAAGEGEIYSLGNVTFRAVRGNENATARGPLVRVLGKNAVIPVEVTRDHAELKLSYTSWYYDDFTPQVAGMRDYAVSQANGYYLLRVGGYMATENVRELAGNTEIGIANVRAVTVGSAGSHTLVAIDAENTIPMNGYCENGIFYISLYNVNTASVGKITLGENPLFTGAEWVKSTKANSIKIALTLRDPDNFYGFEFDYSDEGMTLVLLRNPVKLPADGLPLFGKTIVLDAGHGGTDSGALGAQGAGSGYAAVDEADLNLAITLRAAEALRQLGANVVLTRDGDTTVSIDQRIALLGELEPDLSISIHQNSMPYASDITRIRGLVGLYYADAGRLLTQCISSATATALNRYERDFAEQRLALCRNARFPSTLIEVGFITCVEEYEKMLNAEAIAQAGDAIARGVLDYYAAQAKWVK